VATTNTFPKVAALAAAGAISMVPNRTAPHVRIPANHRRVRPEAGVLTFGAVLFGTLLMTPAAANAATFGNVYVVATAQYDCGSHTVDVYPMTNEHLDGNFSVYSYAQVFDRVSGRWITTGWLLDNGIQGHRFYGMRSYDPYAKVTYARFMNGAWVYKADWVCFDPTLDSMGPFCNP